jgi:hypothetical protein
MSEDLDITYVTLPLPGGPLTVPVISLPQSAFSDLREACTWLVPDMTGDGPDAIECGRPFPAGNVGLVISRPAR